MWSSAPNFGIGVAFCFSEEKQVSNIGMGSQE